MSIKNQLQLLIVLLGLSFNSFANLEDLAQELSNINNHNQNNVLDESTQLCKRDIDLGLSNVAEMAMNIANIPTDNEETVQFRYHIDLDVHENATLCNSNIRFEHSTIEGMKVPNYELHMMRVFKIKYSEIGITKARQTLKYIFENETQKIKCEVMSATENGHVNFFTQYLMRHAQAFTICSLTKFAGIDWDSVVDSKGKKLKDYILKYSSDPDYDQQIAEVNACLRGEDTRYYPEEEEWEDL